MLRKFSHCSPNTIIYNAINSSRTTSTTAPCRWRGYFVVPTSELSSTPTPVPISVTYSFGATSLKLSRFTSILSSDSSPSSRIHSTFQATTFSTMMDESISKRAPTAASNQNTAIKAFIPGVTRCSEVRRATAATVCKIPASCAAVICRIKIVRSVCGTSKV